MNISKNEYIVLNNIALNSYQPTNYGVPETFEETSAIWSHSIQDSSATEHVPTTSLPGVVASLVNKGLATTSSIGRARRDDTVSLTREGYDAWRDAFMCGTVHCSDGDKIPASWSTGTVSHPACITVTTLQGLKVDVNFDRTADVCWSCKLADETLRERSLEAIMRAIAEHIGRTEF